MPNKTDYLKQYVSLRQSLHAEKTKLEARLKSINSALGEASKVASAAPAKAAQATAPVIKKKRTMSAAARAKIAAAQKARWAKFNAAKK